jgi:transketolase
MKYPITLSEKEFLQKTIQMRRDILVETNAAGSGHPGGSLSATELFVTLFFEFLKHDSDNAEWEERDRFILSKCHISPAYYSILARTGYFDPAILTTFRSLGSPLQGHPHRDMAYGIEVSGGSLGQNLSVAVGRALALQRDNKPYYVWSMSSEGELQEGQMWEAIMSAAHYKLDNLTLLVDYNRLQIDGPVEEVMEVEPLDQKFAAFGWEVFTCNGHDHAEIKERMIKAKAVKGKPSVIIARTVKGKGISFMENVAGWHGKAPNAEEMALGMAELDTLESTL